jgi:DNA-binding NarL/FixJ family response regulator
MLLIGSASFRRRIKRDLAGAAFDVVAEAATLRAAAPQLGATANMDLALLQSVGSPGNDLDDLQRLHFLLPGAKVVVLKTTQSGELTDAADSVGIDGCLSPKMPGAALIQALHCIALGHSLFSVNGATLLLGHWASGPGAAAPHGWAEILRGGLLH